MSLVSIELNYQ